MSAISDFESNFPGRIRSPLSNTRLSAAYMKKYTPEDFISWMSEGSNPAYSIDKKKIGAAAYSYSVDTLSDGFVYTEVSDNQTMTGGSIMEVGGKQIPDWAVNIGMYAVSGFLVGFSAQFVNFIITPETSLTDFSNAIYAASVFGFYRAGQQVISYLETLFQPKKTNASGIPIVAEKTMADRML